MKLSEASMLKSIKISVNTLLIAASAILMMLVSSFAILRIPAVQTYLLNGFSGYFSDDIKATVSVSRVNFSFFNRLSVKDLLIKDYNNDTLVYARNVKAGIRKLDTKHGNISIGRVTLEDPYFSVITDSAGVTNISLYLDKLKAGRDSTVKKDTRFSIANIKVSEGKFHLINKAAKPSATPVNFSALRIDSIFGNVGGLEVINDSTVVDVSSLSFRESSGFRVAGMDTRLTLHNNSIYFDNPRILTGQTELNAERIYLLADTSTDFRNFITSVYLDIGIANSVIHSGDLYYFVPALKGFDEYFTFSGNVTGTVSELNGRKIKVRYKEETLLDLDFDLSGLPDIKNTFIFVEVNDFRSISRDIEQLSIPGRGNVLMPEPLRKLGVVSFSGTFTGFTTDFVTYGKINTNKGILSTDISLRPEGKNNFRIKGMIRGNSIDLSSLTEKSNLLGQITVEANVDGVTEAFKKFNLTVNGLVDSVEFNGYNYRNIELNGLFNNKSWDGNIKIADKNINMELLGMLDFSEAVPGFDFTLNLKHADLYRLNFARKDTSAAASMLLTANFKGNNIDNLDGEIKLLNSSFTKYSKQLEIYDFSLKTFIQNSAPAIALRTDFIDASLEGRYNFSSLAVVAGIALADMFPSKFSIPEKLFKPRDNIFKYSVTFKNTDRLNDFLRTGLRISENSSISGNVYRDSLFTLNARSRLFSRGTVAFNDLSINAVYSAKKGLISVKTTNLDLSGLAGLNNFNINASAEKDNFIVSGKWDSNQKVVNSGSFEAHGLFVGTEEPGKGTKMEIEIRPSDIYVKDDTWKIAHARILTDSTSVKVEGFRIGTEKSFFTVNGAVSADLRDTLKLGFSDLNLNPVNYLYEKKLHNDPNMIHLALGGRVNGEVSITNILRSFMFQSNIAVNNFTLLGSEYGTIDIGSVWNPENSVADISIGNNFNGKNMFMIGGTYDPASKNAVLEIVTNKMPVDILNPLLKSFASGISGTATGKVRMTGALNQPVLNGSVWAENGQLKIDYLQTKYRFSDSIRFNSKGIEFRNIQVKDERNNIALFAGMVYHKYFKNFTVDLNMKTNETMVLNTRPKDNELFYGTAYASGVTTIKTKGNILEFGISAKTGKNTRFFIPLNSGMNISDNRSVTFITRDTSSKKDAPVPLAKSVSAATLMELSIDLEVTPDAELQLIMDPKAGDIMKGKGAGNLNVSLDRKGVFKIFGDYLINNGDYLFTLGNIINKPFSVNPGGRITFNGDLENAEIDIKAIYSTKAALYDIMPGIPDPKLKERIPVECQLLLSGKLFNPVVGFEINLPTADEETRAYLRSMIKSEEEMSRQFLFLLVMNKFYSDPQAGIATSTAAMGTTTVGVTTMEMFSSQISNWLSQISNNFDIDMNYRPGTSDLPNSDELQLALSTQLLNDKVKINGNFDVAGSNANLNNPVPGAGNSQITGAFDIEYSINEKVKFKFFNRSNDNFYTNNGVQYTQGLGLFFRQDFNRLRDLFRPSKKNTDKKGRK